MSQNDFKLLNDIPLMSITEIKEAPMRGFKEAEKNGTGVYITNRGDVVGVMLTNEQYESMVNDIEELLEQINMLVDDGDDR